MIFPKAQNVLIAHILQMIFKAKFHGTAKLSLKPKEKNHDA